MDSRSRILELLLKCIEESMEYSNSGEGVEFNESSLLLAEGSSIDSLQLVNIIVDFEASLFDSFEIQISLTSDDAMSRARSPFHDVKSLCDYVQELIA